MGFLWGLVVGGALGVVATVVLGLVVHTRQQPQPTRETKPDTDDVGGPLTMTYSPTQNLDELYKHMLRYRELVDDDGNLRRH